MTLIRFPTNPTIRNHPIALRAVAALPIARLRLWRRLGLVLRLMLTLTAPLALIPVRLLRMMHQRHNHVMSPCGCLCSPLPLSITRASRASTSGHETSAHGAAVMVRTAFITLSSKPAKTCLTHCGICRRGSRPVEPPP